MLCNRKYREFFAVSADLMVRGNSFEEILRGAVARGQYPAAKDDPEGWIKVVLERRREAAGSSELQLADRWLHVTNRRTSDGGIVGILSDITERIKQEEMLRERETRLRSLMANMPGGIYRCRADWTEVLMSDGIEPITGYPAAAFCEDRKVSISQLIHPEDRDGILAATARCLENRTSYAVEYRLIDRSGKIHWVLDQGRPIYDNDGTLLWIDGVLFDITERKQMEGEVHRLQTRMTDAIESIGEAFVLWGADERLVLCNKKYRELFDPDGNLLVPGRSLEEVIRMNVASGRHPEFASDPEGWIQERLRRYRAAAGDSEMKIPGDRWLRVIDRRTSEGGIVGIRTDITERKNAELELRAANESLKEAMQKLASSERMATIGQVAATVSHELRNPLGAIRNSMALVHQLTAGKQLGVERALERVDRNIERCTAIIAAMLEFTHEKEITRTPTAIAAWLAEMLASHPMPEGISDRARLCGPPTTSPSIASASSRPSSASSTMRCRRCRTRPGLRRRTIRAASRCARRAPGRMCGCRSSTTVRAFRRTCCRASSSRCSPPRVSASASACRPCARSSRSMAAPSMSPAPAKAARP